MAAEANMFSQTWEKTFTELQSLKVFVVCFYLYYTIEFWHAGMVHFFCRKLGKYLVEREQNLFVFAPSGHDKDTSEELLNCAPAPSWQSWV